MTFLTAMDPQTGLVDRSAAHRLGLDLQDTYNAGEPFPHIMIDDFLPLEIIEKCLEHFHHGGTESASYSRPQEQKKHEYRPDEMHPELRNLFYSFNSLPFIKVLENITGIQGLIPDPYFRGAGFHEIRNGGHLSVHADFNHHVSMDLERRINLLIYLNADWKPEYGGQLELWSNDMSTRHHSIVPMLNRAVMFNTTSFSNHGNPNPVDHPHNISRKSIALYFYTATWDHSKRSHTTQFRARPKSEDKIDWSVKGREFADDLLPPIVRRAVRSLKTKKTN
ncbi:MAG: 2OG-Fe(II) oxygenase [Parvularcula sp.]|jgi:Rps23 Pro-64 3,4-dihydroxylase Tpa1-like proline 4-hydroxylase|nr:2OG-Fe(II) oxygenase [Parvularcula sp.]